MTNADQNLNTDESSIETREVDTQGARVVLGPRMMTDGGSEEDPDDEPEWGMDRIASTLMDINDAITDDNLHEATLSGDAGFHIFATNDGPATRSLNKHLHIAFDEAIEQIHLDYEDVDGSYGEVTPETVAREFECQFDEFLGMYFGERMADELEQQLRENWGEGE